MPNAMTEEWGPALNLDRDWWGYLTLVNATEVKERMLADFGGRRFVTVVANGFFSFKPEVHVDCRFVADWVDRSTDEVKLTTSTLDDGREMVSLLWSSAHYAWSIHSYDADQKAAHAAPETSRTYLMFNRRHGQPQLTIEQFNGNGDRMYWTLVRDEISPVD